MGKVVPAIGLDQPAALLTIPVTLALANLIAAWPGWAAAFAPPPRSAPSRPPPGPP